MSLAFTFRTSTSFFTRETSPFRQASNSSLKAPFGQPPPLLLLLPGLLLPVSGVETSLVPLLSVVVGELALLLVLLLLRAGAGEEVVGEAGVTSPSGVLSIPASRESGVASSDGAGGEPAGVMGREEPLVGEDSWEFGCCC